MSDEPKRVGRSVLGGPVAILLGVVALALGLGLAAAVVLFLRSEQQPVYPEADELVRIEYASPGGDRKIETGLLELWAERQGSLEYLAAWFEVEMVFRGDGIEAHRYFGACVEPRFFDLAGVPPQLGRVPSSYDDLPDAAFAVVLGDAVWRFRYGGDPAVVGRTVVVGGSESDGVEAAILGVMPDGFELPRERSFWLPLTACESSQDPRGRGLDVLGRLRDGVSPERAQQELEQLARGWERGGAGGGSVVVRRLRDS